MSTNTVRLFVGLAPPRSATEDLARRTYQALRPAAKRLAICAARDLHLTLVFLGEMPADSIPALTAELEREVGRKSAPELVLARTGAFPSAGRERVLWVAASTAEQERERLMALRAAVIAAVRTAGWKGVDGTAETWVPHVTLARVHGRVRVPEFEPFYALAFDHAWRPDAVLLYETRGPAGAGPRYAVRARIALAAPGP